MASQLPRRVSRKPFIPASSAPHETSRKEQIRHIPLGNYANGMPQH